MLPDRRESNTLSTPASREVRPLSIRDRLIAGLGKQLKSPDAISLQYERGDRKGGMVRFIVIDGPEGNTHVFLYLFDHIPEEDQMMRPVIEIEVSR